MFTLALKRCLTLFISVECTDLVGDPELTVVLTKIVYNFDVLFSACFFISSFPSPPRKGQIPDNCLLYKVHTSFYEHNS